MSVQEQIMRISGAKTDIATAIAAKGVSVPSGTKLDGMAPLIAGIQTGGSGGAVVEKDVNFYDYDGTPLHSYTLDELQELTKLPDLPTREGLICQGWNWTLDDLKMLGRAMDVGAVYKTDDGKTRINVRVETSAHKNANLCIQQSVANGVTVDWGDGTNTETANGTGAVTFAHTYANFGEYTITLNPTNGCELGFGDGTSSNNVMGTIGNAHYARSAMMESVFIGANVTSISEYAFARCYGLKYVTIPNEVTVLGGYCMYYCYSLDFLVLPNTITDIPTNFIRYNNAIKGICLPNSIVNIQEYSLAVCYAMRKICLPDSVLVLASNAISNMRANETIVFPKHLTELATGVAQACYSTRTVVLPEDLIIIGNSAFSGNPCMQEVIIPKGVRTIVTNAFKNCYGILLYDFSACEAVPTLENTAAFSGISSNCKIKIPSSLVAEWAEASNWSYYVDNFIWN